MKTQIRNKSCLGRRLGTVVPLQARPHNKQTDLPGQLISVHASECYGASAERLHSPSFSPGDYRDSRNFEYPLPCYVLRSAQRLRAAMVAQSVLEHTVCWTVSVCRCFAFVYCTEHDALERFSSGFEAWSCCALACCALEVSSTRTAKVHAVQSVVTVMLPCCTRGSPLRHSMPG